MTLVDVLFLGIVAGVSVLALSWRGLRVTRGLRWGQRLRRIAAVVSLCLFPLVTGLPALAALPASDRDELAALIAVALAFCAWWLAAASAVRVQKLAGHEACAPLEGAALARVRELSGVLGIEPPRALILPTHGRSLNMLAWCGGTLNPTLLVTDGLLHRLPPEERDAVLAHELAHVATGSLWWYAASVPVAVTFGVLIAPHLPFMVTIWATLAARQLLRSVVAPRFELACDMAGARVTSHAAMAASLGKVHAVHRLDRERFVDRWARAMGTHPSLRMRHDALGRESPDVAERGAGGLSPTIHESPAAAAELQSAQLRGLATDIHGSSGLADAGRAVAWRVISALVLVAGLVVAGLGHPLVGSALLAAAACAPVLFLLAATRSPGKSFRLAGRASWELWTMLVGAALLVAAPFVAAAGPSHALVVALGVGAVGVALWSASRKQRRRRFLVEAVLSRDPAILIDRVRRSRKGLERDADLACLVAMPLWRSGHGAEALGLLERQATRLAARRGAGRSTSRAAVLEMLGNLELARDPLSSLRRASDLRQIDGHSRLGRALEAKALWLAGRPGDARKAALAGLDGTPFDATFHVIVACAAADEGLLTLAAQHVEQAAALAPGDVHVVVATAYLALAEGRDATEAIAAARAAAQATPWALVEAELARLERASPGAAET